MRLSKLQAEPMTLTKADLAKLLFEQVGLNKREAMDMIDMVFEEMRGTLERGNSVKRSGFGNVQVRDKPERPGRNPKTGEDATIAARRGRHFPRQQKAETVGGQWCYGLLSFNEVAASLGVMMRSGWPRKKATCTLMARSCAANALFLPYQVLQAEPR